MKNLSDMLDDLYEEYATLLNAGEWQKVRDKLKADSERDPKKQPVVEVANLQKMALVITKNIACLRIARDELLTIHNKLIETHGF